MMSLIHNIVVCSMRPPTSTASTCCLGSGSCSSSSSEYGNPRVASSFCRIIHRIMWLRGDWRDAAASIGYPVERRASSALRVMCTSIHSPSPPPRPPHYRHLLFRRAVLRWMRCHNCFNCLNSRLLRIPTTLIRLTLLRPTLIRPTLIRARLVRPRIPSPGQRSHDDLLCTMW